MGPKLNGTLVSCGPIIKTLMISKLKIGYWLQQQRSPWIFLLSGRVVVQSCRKSKLTYSLCFRWYWVSWLRTFHYWRECRSKPSQTVIVPSLFGTLLGCQYTHRCEGEMNSVTRVDIEPIAPGEWWVAIKPITYVSKEREKCQGIVFRNTTKLDIPIHHIPLLPSRTAWRTPFPLWSPGQT